jgi:hypothetical protein
MLSPDLLVHQRNIATSARVAQAADVGMDDRRTVRGSLVCGVSINLMVEDGANQEGMRGAWSSMDTHHSGANGGCRAGTDVDKCTLTFEELKQRSIHE